MAPTRTPKVKQEQQLSFTSGPVDRSRKEVIRTGWSSEQDKMIITTAMKAAEAILWKTLGENPLMKGKTRWGLTVRYRTLMKDLATKLEMEQGGSSGKVDKNMKDERSSSPSNQ